MKFFYTNSSADIHTYTVNFAEYVRGIEMNEVISKFSEYIQLPKGVVSKSLSFLIHPNAFEEQQAAFLEVIKNNSRWTANEWSQLVELAGFISYVRSSETKDGVNMESRVLHFCNLNSGKSFSWIHSIC